MHRVKAKRKTNHLTETLQLSRLTKTQLPTYTHNQPVFYLVVRNFELKVQKYCVLNLRISQVANSTKLK